MRAATGRLGWAAALAVGVGVGVPVAVAVGLPEDSRVSMAVAEAVARRIKAVEDARWRRGDGRPNRIILVRHGQTHGYSTLVLSLFLTM